MSQYLMVYTPRLLWFIVFLIGLLSLSYLLNSSFLNHTEIYFIDYFCVFLQTIILLMQATNVGNLSVLHLQGKNGSTSSPKDEVRTTHLFGALINLCYLLIILLAKMKESPMLKLQQFNCYQAQLLAEGSYFQCMWFKSVIQTNSNQSWLGIIPKEVKGLNKSLFFIVIQ